VATFTHSFVRQSVPQLPTFSWWFDKNPLYPQFTGCMLNKLDLECKARELVTMDTEWVGLGYDTTGIAQSPTYSRVRPFAFNMMSVTVDGSPVLNYDNFKLTINNMVKADHALSGSIYPAKIYSEGMQAELSGDLFFEDATQYNKFLAGTTAAFVLMLTSADDISGAAAGQKYSLTITIPKVIYKSANFPIPTGVLKIPFIGTAMFDDGVTNETLDMVLKNAVSSAY
jgi:hypothetical protein